MKKKTSCCLLTIIAVFAVIAGIVALRRMALTTRAFEIEKAVTFLPKLFDEIDTSRFSSVNGASFHSFLSSPSFIFTFKIDSAYVDIFLNKNGFKPYGSTKIPVFEWALVVYKGLSDVKYKSYINEHGSLLYEIDDQGTFLYKH